LTVTMFTVFCWAIALIPVNRTANSNAKCLFIALFEVVGGVLGRNSLSIIGLLFVEESHGGFFS